MTHFLLIPYRSLVEIGTNYAGAESERDMGSAVLNFDMDTAGRIAVYLFLRDLQRNFDGKIWVQNGIYIYYPSTPSLVLALQACTFPTLDLCFDYCNYIYNFCKQY